MDRAAADTAPRALCETPQLPRDRFPLNYLPRARAIVLTKVPFCSLLSINEFLRNDSALSQYAELDRPLTRKARERGIGKYKIVHMFVFKMAKLSHRRARARAVRSPTVPAHRVRASPCSFLVQQQQQQLEFVVIIF